MTLIARWHIGPVQQEGFDSLVKSINSFCRFYPAKPHVYFNCPRQQLIDSLEQTFQRTPFEKFPTFHDQAPYGTSIRQPKGVAWKLYPPRHDLNCHEIVIDNDLILESTIPELDHFINHDCCVVLEDTTRCYGRFDAFVSPGHKINSGIYAMPPGFDLGSFVEFYGGHEWEENALGEYRASRTFDEQGLIAIALPSYRNFAIIPESTITSCEFVFKQGLGMHFIGLNRRGRSHRPYREFCTQNIKLYL